MAFLQIHAKILVFTDIWVIEYKDFGFCVCIIDWVPLDGALDACWVLSQIIFLRHKFYFLVKPFIEYKLFLQRWLYIPWPNGTAPKVNAIFSPMFLV